MHKLVVLILLIVCVDNYCVMSYTVLVIRLKQIHCSIAISHR